MSDAFIELDESIKQERLHKFWAQYGIFVITGLASIVIATALFQGFYAWNIRVEQQQTSLIIEALEKDNAPEILIGAANDMRPALRGIALLSAGGILLENDQRAEALKIYTQASQDTKIPLELRALATLMSVNLSEETDDIAATFGKLKDIWSGKNNPWELQARLESALLLAHKSNDYAAALTQLDIILQTPGISKPMRSKAGALKHVYSLQMNDTEQTQR